MIFHRLIFNLLERSNPIISTATRCKSTILTSLKKNPVLVSANKDVYTNLALEHWLYTNLDFNGDNDNSLSNPVVLIWTDEPCLVIGRHQNPWIETNLGYLHKNGLKLARRHSGGGCVYHDENNINISIIGHRNTFERRQDNLKFIAQIFLDKYGVKCEVTKRHDILHLQTGLKISGSAAKLGKNNCYHHFTVLVNSNIDNLYSSIRTKQQEFIISNSTQSFRSKVMNLCQIKPTLEVNQIITDLSNEYSKLFRTNTNIDTQVKSPKPSISLSSSTSTSTSTGTSASDNDNHIDSQETSNKNEFMKSLTEMRDQLQSWQWIYGMTPKFKLDKSFNVIIGGQQKKVELAFHINKGLFEAIHIGGDLESIELSQSINNYLKCLIGTKFTYTDAMVNISKLLQLDRSLDSDEISMLGPEQLSATFALQMVHDANY